MRSGHRHIARHREIGNSKELFTTESRRHGEKSDHLMMAGTSVDRIGETASLSHPERVRVEFCETSASPRTPILQRLANAASGSSHNLLVGLRNAWDILRSALREIFDESAYDRFLLRTNSAQSVASYRAFEREREDSIAQKPRCC